MLADLVVRAERDHARGYAPEEASRRTEIDALRWVLGIASRLADRADAAAADAAEAEARRRRLGW
jgi:hypothetical protein